MSFSCALIQSAHSGSLSRASAFADSANRGFEYIGIGRIPESSRKQNKFSVHTILKDNDLHSIYIAFIIIYIVFPWDQQRDST